MEVCEADETSAHGRCSLLWIFEARCPQQARNEWSGRERNGEDMSSLQKVDCHGNRLGRMEKGLDTKSKGKERSSNREISN